MTRPYSPCTAAAMRSTTRCGPTTTRSCLKSWTPTCRSRRAWRRSRTNEATTADATAATIANEHDTTRRASRGDAIAAARRSGALEVMTSRQSDAADARVRAMTPLTLIRAGIISGDTTTELVRPHRTNDPPTSMWNGPIMRSRRRPRFLRTPPQSGQRTNPMKCQKRSRLAKLFSGNIYFWFSTNWMICNWIKFELVEWSGLLKAEKMMAKMGYKEGDGLGRNKQGMSIALQVEKTGKRSGRIIHEKDVVGKSLLVFIYADRSIFWDLNLTSISLPKKILQIFHYFILIHFNKNEIKSNVGISNSWSP